jgi:nitrogen fixation protein FixH
MLEIDPHTARKNMLLGWALFGVFVLLFAGTVAVALVYLWIAG